MRDGKLLSDNEIESTQLRRQTAFAIQSTQRTGKRVSLWAIIAFCAVGLIGALLVPSPYLHFEQTTTLLAEAPLS
jgi:type VI protein secretion system component VasF